MLSELSAKMIYRDSDQPQVSCGDALKINIFFYFTSFAADRQENMKAPLFTDLPRCSKIMTEQKVMRFTIIISS